MAWNVSRVPLLAALALLASAGSAAAEPAKAQNQNALKTLPTGAEDEPAAAAPLARAAAVAPEIDLDAMTSRSSEGLTQVLHADGTISVDLEGRFMNVVVATPGADGRATVSCVDHVERASPSAAPATSRPTAPIDARAAARAKAGTVVLPAGAPVSAPPALEER